MSIITNVHRSAFGIVTKGLAGAAIAVLSSAAAWAQPVQLNFWDMIWGPPEYIDATKSLVDEFNKTHPNIQVVYRSVPWNNWYQTFLTAVGAGTAPDISTGGAFQSVQLYDQGAIRPVDDLIADLKKDGEFDDFQPGSIETLRYDNHYVALPWAADIRVWYYRKSLLDAAHQSVPTNWAEFAKVAKATTGNGKYGLVGSGDTGGSQYIYTAILNNGGGLFSPDRKLTLMSDRNVEAVTAYANMVKEGSVSPASAGYSYDDARSSFQRGEAAFMLDTPGAIDSAPQAIKGDIAVLPPLTGPHGDKGTVFWVNNIMIYTQSQHPEEDKTFVMWWSKNQKPLWTTGHSTELPIRKSIAGDPYFIDNAATSQIIKEYIPIGKTTATKAQGIFPALNDLEGEGTFQSFVQQLWQGKPVSDMFSTAEARLKAVLKE
jgi:multiple sugar transport system substrate-binding protein